jgi:hypothetical protein
VSVSYTYNPFDPDAVPPWTLRIAGVLYADVSLTAIGGLKIKREWTAQKSKETSENVYVWKGETTEQPELTLEAVDRASFSEILALLRAMAPVPVAGGTSASSKTSSTTGQTSTAGGSAAAAAPGSPPVTAESLLAQAQAAANALAKGSSTTSSSSTTTSSSSTTTAQSNPGPRPPTLSIENPMLSLAGITAFACGDLELPTPNAEQKWTMKVKIVPQKPQVPTAAGSMAPAGATPGSQFASQGGQGAGGGGGAAGGTTSGQSAMASNAKAAAAGT